MLRRGQAGFVPEDDELEEIVASEEEDMDFDEEDDDGSLLDDELLADDDIPALPKSTSAKVASGRGKGKKEDVAQGLGMDEVLNGVPVGSIPLEGNGGELQQISTAPSPWLQHPVLDMETANQISPWLNGQESDPPVSLQKLTTNYAKKMSWMVALFAADGMMQVGALSCFLRSAAEMVFDPEKLRGMTYEDQKEALTLALKVQGQYMEFIRRFLKDSASSLADMGTEAELLREAILRLPPEKITQIREELERGEVE